MTDYFENKIPKFILQYFPTDKILHFTVSFILLLIFFWIRKIFLKEEWFVRILAFSLRDVIIIWIFKEIIDLFGFWNAEFWDLLADFSWLIIPIYLFFIIKLSTKLKTSTKIKYEKKLIEIFKNKKDIKNFLYLLVIWFVNIFYLILKIPFLAFKETILVFTKIFK